jgi:hypothetical protein
MNPDDRSMDGSPAMPPNASTLTRLPATVSLPGYDRSALRAGIVHIGLADEPGFVRDLPVAAALGVGPRETIGSWLSVRGARR